MKNTSVKNRSIYHDLLRVFATFAVICIHVCSESVAWESKPLSSPTWEYLNIFGSMSRFAVPVFVMLSGSFMLDKYKQDSLKKLYSKNILRLVCAFVFWKVFYTVLTTLTGFGTGHLWFIPMLIFLYAITPFVQKICSEIKYERYFLILAFAPMIVRFLQEYIGIGQFYSLFENAGMEFVSGYTVYYVLGHYLTKQDIAKKYRIIIYLTAIVSLAFTVLVAYETFSVGSVTNAYVYEYLSPNVLIMSVALFLLFKYGVSKINFKEQTVKVIVKLSSLTFGIYLTHMVFVKLFLMSPITVESINPLISVPVLTVIIFTISTLVTWIISKIPILKKYII